MKKLVILILGVAGFGFNALGQNVNVVNPIVKVGNGIGPVNVILRDTTGAYVAAGGGGGGGGDFTIAAFNAAFGVAGTADSQVMSVQGIAGGTALPVSVASIPSHAVTNAGTFAVQVTSAPSTAVTNAGTFAVQATQTQKTGVPSSFAVATADGTVFTLAAGETGFIQNLDSADALAVKQGASASTSSFNYILPCGSAADDGTGGTVVIKDWVGAVSVATMTGTARYIAWKVAP